MKARTCNPNFAQVKFQCQYHTVFTEELKLVGNIEELGNWDINKSIAMKTDSSNYPLWESTIEFICPIGMTIEYKFLVYTTKGYIWEKLPNPIEPRKVALLTSGNYIITNKQGSPNVEILVDENLDRKLSFNNNENIQELISYEHNNMTCDVLDETVDFTLSQKIQSDDKIILVTTLLPVTVVKKEEGGYELKTITTNTVTARLVQIKEQQNATVKWVGILSEYLSYTEEELKNIQEFLGAFDYYLVTPKREDYNNFFLYLQKILFPIFSGSLFDRNNEDLFKNEQFFEAFQSVNINFSNVIANIMLEKDVIILNDMALGLVPNTLVQKNYNASIGIYLDYAIPSSDVVKIYPNYQEIIKSILLCDVIGFHFFMSARNFLSVLERFFGLFFEISKKGLISISYLGRTILFHIAHSVIDVSFINELKEKNEFKYQDKYYQSLFSHKFTVMSIDHSVFWLSIAMKLRAINHFFENNRHLIGKVIFCLCLKHLYGKQITLEPHLDKMIKEIKNKYGEDSIRLEQFMQFEIPKRLAIMNNSKVLLYPFYYQGHCIFAYEYLALQNEDQDYHIILGENTCVTAKIKSVKKVNAFNPTLISNMIKDCYNAKQDINKYSIDSSSISKYSTFNWITSFILDMKRVKYYDSLNKFGIGFGLGFSLVKLNSKFSHLKQKSLLDKYQKTSKRVLFFDYENILQEINILDSVLSLSSKEKELYIPSKRVIHILKDLALDKNNLIFVLSKDSMDNLIEWFKEVPSIGLAGECGFFYRYPLNNEINQLIDQEMSWKETVLKILKGFTDKTELSYIDIKEASISWIYKNSDPYFGRIQSNEIKTHLHSIFENKLEITNSEGCLVIKPKNSNKGYFISHILRKEVLKKNNDLDFIFAVGADSSDESMFKYLHSVQRYFPYFNPKIIIITATIGKKPSNSQWFFNEINELIENLEMLSLVNRKKLNIRNTVSYYSSVFPLIPFKKKNSVKLDHPIFPSDENNKS